MRFTLVNIGCKVNRVEVDDAGAQLIAQGAAPCADGDADIVIVNTCTVTGEADKKTRKAVRQALREHPRAQLLVTGCAATMNPGWFEDLDPRVHVVAKPQLARKAWDLSGEKPAYGHLRAASQRSPAGADGGGVASPPPALRVGGGFRTRVGIKAQDGCDNACTFCIVHVARGASRSVPLERVVSDARAHAGAGAREIVLTGINLGAYDDGGRRLPQLLEALLGACSGTRIRIGSVEPRDVSMQLIELMAASDGRICRHLHLPLQSGSSRVLAEMHRPYDADAFIGLVSRLRAAMPQVSLSTDIIVGFPGEGDSDFGDTLALAREAAFSRIHVFRYSRREGTPAAARTDQVDPATVAQRARALSDLGRALRIADARRRAGSTEEVLVERPGRGTAESYHAVVWDASAMASALPAVGEMLPVPLTEPAEDGIFHV